MPLNRFFPSLFEYLAGNTRSEATGYALTSWFFLRIIALIYAAAFVSMSVQIEGLIGSDGILPAVGYLDAVHNSVGKRAYWLYPTFFWLDASDQALLAACVIGVLASVAVFMNRLVQPALILCYLLYLSIVTVGQVFTSFQWDMFLLEAGFLAIFLCNGSRIIIFLYRWLLFRFMFLGGLVKIFSGDPNWQELTALRYHYETQPLPSPLAWYAHHLPDWFNRLSVGAVLFIELVMPFLIFLPRRFRFAAAWSFLLLQSTIILTGNYNFFNLLTVSLCLFLFDDQALTGIVGVNRAGRIAGNAPTAGRSATMVAAGLALIVLVSNATLAWSSYFRRPAVEPLNLLMQATLILGIANTYGPFAVMTTRRGEIEIEASLNGVDWYPYEFRYKPGDLNRDAAWIIPHQPRLDWQMWFAALQPDRPPFWFFRLIRGLEDAKPEITGLFASVPFPNRSPRYLRARYYQYRFTSPGQRANDGTIWKRQYLGRYWPPKD